MNQMRPVRMLLAAALVLALGACDTINDIFEEEEVKLPGERIAVLSVDQKIEADPRLDETRVLLPRPYANAGWTQAGGTSTHAMYHLELGAAPTRLFAVNVGSGTASDRPLMPNMVLAEGVIFVRDTDYDISAVDAGSGQLLWRADIARDTEDDDTFGGGIAWYGGLVLATTGFGHVVALDAATGAEAWRARLGAPMRAAPVVDSKHVYAVTLDNRLHAITLETGEVAWDYVGVSEVAGLLGAAPPATDGSIVIAPFSSGEIVAVRADTGRQLWTEQLAGVARQDSVSQLADIRGAPVIDRDRLIAVGSSGITASLDLRTGRRAWDQRYGGVQTPWAAGDWFYMITLENEVLAVERETGRVRWATPLPRYGDPEDREDPIFWTGPVLVSDRLIVASSEGEIYALSPYTGALLGSIEIADGVQTTPIVANGTLYVLTNDADLIAYR